VAVSVTKKKKFYNAACWRNENCRRISKKEFINIAPREVSVDGTATTTTTTTTTAAAATHIKKRMSVVSKAAARCL
jgi:hypothetical protein